jgi:hypothetical protein
MPLYSRKYYYILMKYHQTECNDHSALFKTIKRAK